MPDKQWHIWWDRTNQAYLEMHGQICRLKFLLKNLDIWQQKCAMMSAADNTCYACRMYHKLPVFNSVSGCWLVDNSTDFVTSPVTGICCLASFSSPEDHQFSRSHRKQPTTSTEQNINHHYHRNFTALWTLSKVSRVHGHISSSRKIRPDIMSSECRQSAEDGWHLPQSSCDRLAQTQWPYRQ